MLYPWNYEEERWRGISHERALIVVTAWDSFRSSKKRRNNKKGRQTWIQDSGLREERRWDDGQKGGRDEHEKEANTQGSGEWMERDGENQMKYYMFSCRDSSLADHQAYSACRSDSNFNVHFILSGRAFKIPSTSSSLMVPHGYIFYCSSFIAPLAILRP